MSSLQFMAAIVSLLLFHDTNNTHWELNGCTKSRTLSGSTVFTKSTKVTKSPILLFTVSKIVIAVLVLCCNPSDSIQIWYILIYCYIYIQVIEDSLHVTHPEFHGKFDTKIIYFFLWISVQQKFYGCTATVEPC